MASGTQPRRPRQGPGGRRWPWVVRGIFALPAAYPQGLYRQQVIHFGLSLKDEPTNRGIWDIWLGKSEAVLGRLYWSSAVAHVHTDFEPPRVFEWVPTEGALGRLYDDPPAPVSEWVRSVRIEKKFNGKPNGQGNSAAGRGAG